MRRKMIRFILLMTVSALFGCGVVHAEEKLQWWQKTVVYEAYPGSFKDSNGDGYGDIPGLISELDHLKSLGVGAIWLTPVFASPMKDNGYDVADYYSINPLFGTMEDMDCLIKEARDRDIRIVMDLVFNHTSDECAWFAESRSSADAPKSDWYIWRDPAPDGGTPNNWRGIFGGSAWTWCEERGQYYLHTFADFQPDLNWENPEVRRTLYDAANFWLDKGVGGFRVDAVTYIKKPTDFSGGEADGSDGLCAIHDKTANSEGILDFLREFRYEVREGKDIFMVGEANGVPSDELDMWVGPEGVFDMIFRFDLVNIQFAQGEVWSKTKDFTIGEFRDILVREQKATAENGWCPVFFENHDQPRSVRHFLPWCEDEEAGAKALGMLLMTLRGTPFIYQGEELGMTNVDRAGIEEYDDVSSHNQFAMALQNGLSEAEALDCVRRFSRDNARSPMQWDATENAGFTSGTPWLPVNENYLTVNVAVESEDPGSVLNWYGKLNELRQAHTVLTDGSFREISTGCKEIFSYERVNESETATILVNLSGRTVTYDATVIQGRSLMLTDRENSEAGILQPYEAVCYIGQTK